MKKKNEDTPANATGSAVAGTGSDVAHWKKKKKKKKNIYDGKNMDLFHDLMDKGKSAEEISKIMKMDIDAVKIMLEDVETPEIPVNTPDSTFASMPVFKVSSDDFAKCKFGKSKFARWAKHIDIDSESGKRIHAYAKKNPNKSIIVQHEKSGHMLYLRKYSTK
jgi:seryl-tRNA synthetase